MNSTRKGTLWAALSLLALASVPPAHAQAGPGREGTLSYGVGLDYDFDSGLATTTDLAVTLRTRTAIDQFDLRFGTQIYGDFTDSGSDDFSFRNRSLNAQFARRVSNSALRLSAGYTETELEDQVDTSGPVLIITDDGQLATTNASVSVQTGNVGPFGLSFDARYVDRDYTGTTDPSLEDETQVGADVVARFGLSQTLDLRALAGINRIDEDDAAGTIRETSYYGLGLGGTTAGNLTFSADLLFDSSEVTTTAPASSVVDEGLGFRLDVSQQRPDGTVGAQLSSRVDDAGRRTTARVSRSFSIPTGGLSVSLGVVDQEGDNQLRMVGSVDYTRTAGDGQTFTVAASQDAATDDSGTVISTRLSLSYDRDIDSVSGWQAGLGYFATDDIGGTDDNRTTASLSYRRSITPEWSMRTGYSYSREDDGTEGNSVFFNVTRDIAFGF